jgi:excisionase family DNA binding protein
MQLMTTAEAAQVLKLSPRTVREMATRGDLKSVKLGRQYRFRPSDLTFEPVQPNPEDRKKSRRVQEEFAQSLAFLRVTPGEIEALEQLA